MVLILKIASLLFVLVLLRLAFLCMTPRSVLVSSELGPFLAYQMSPVQQGRFREGDEAKDEAKDG